MAMLGVAAFVFIYYTFWALLTVCLPERPHHCRELTVLSAAFPTCIISSPRPFPTKRICRSFTRHPRACWRSRSSGFYWTSDDEGSTKAKGAGRKGCVRGVLGYGDQHIDLRRHDMNAMERQTDSAAQDDSFMMIRSIIHVSVL